MRARAHDGGKFRARVIDGAVAHPEAAHGEAAADAFGAGDQVRLHLRADGFPAHRGPAAAKAALHFVDHQQKILLAAKLRHRTQELRLHGVDAALALHGFQQNAAGDGADGRAQGFDVVEVHIAEAHEHRVELNLDFFLTRGGHGAEGAAVETLVERDDLVARRAVRLRAAVAEAAGYLDDAVIRLCAGVAEEDATGDAHDLAYNELCQLLLSLHAVEVRAVHQRMRLLAEGLHHRRVAMPQTAGRNPAAEVHIASPLRVVQVGSLTLRRRKRRATVCRKYVFRTHSAKKSTPAPPFCQYLCSPEVLFFRHSVKSGVQNRVC